MKGKTRKVFARTPLLVGEAVLGWFLIQADQVSGGVAKSSSDLRRVSADRLHQLASVGDHCVDRRRHAVNHDVDEQARLQRWRAAGDPCAAHFTRRVIERRATIAALSELPAENIRVEMGCTLDVVSRDLDVANFSVCQGGCHLNSAFEAVGV